MYVVHSTTNKTCYFCKHTPGKYSAWGSSRKFYTEGVSEGDRIVHICGLQ